jgi:hypothetical protein
MNVKSVVANLILLLVSVCVGLAAAESYLAYDNWHPNTSDYLTEVRLNGTTYRFIERREAIDDAKNAILIAGDSFTAGNACAAGKTYPDAFTNAAKQHGSPLHAVNMGVPGTGPFSYALRLKDYFAEKGPTAGAIMTLYANDAEIDCQVCRHLDEWAKLGEFSAEEQAELRKLCSVCFRQDNAQPVAGEVNVVRRFNWWLADRSLSYQLFREMGARLAVKTGFLSVNWGRAAFPHRWNDREGLYFKYVQASIAYARREADSHGVPLMVVIYPDPIGLNSRNEFVDIYAGVQGALTASTGVPVYSGYDAFLGNPATRNNMVFSLSDAHPNCQAHAIFGQWVFSTWAKLHLREQQMKAKS